MDFIILKDFLVSYSLPTVIISFSVALCCILLGVIFKEKLSAVKGYLPFILSTLSYLVYDMVCLGKITFREETFYAGILCGSLSVFICSTLKKIGKGETNGSALLLIEGLIKSYIIEEKLSETALSLDNLIAQNNGDDENLLDNIYKLLKGNALTTISDDDVVKLAYLVIKTVKSLKN